MIVLRVFQTLGRLKTTAGSPDGWQRLLLLSRWPTSVSWQYRVQLDLAEIRSAHGLNQVVGHDILEQVTLGADADRRGNPMEPSTMLFQQAQGRHVQIDGQYDANGGSNLVVR